jgi:chemotaxis protein MotB
VRKIDPKRLVAVSLAEYEPIAPNDTPEGRQKNRRIAITLEPSRPEPVAAPPPPAAAPVPAAMPAPAAPPDPSEPPGQP